MSARPRDDVGVYFDCDECAVRTRGGAGILDEKSAEIAAPYLQHSPALSRQADAVPLQRIAVVLCLLIFDCIAPLALGYLAWSLHPVPVQTFWAVCGKFSIVGAVFAVLIFRSVGCYRTEQFLDFPRALRTLLTGFAWLILVGFTAAFLSKSLLDLSRVWSVLWLVSWASAAIATRAYASRTMVAKAAAGNLVETVAIVGATEWTHALCTQLATQKQPGVRVIGIFDDRRSRVPRRFADSVQPIDSLLELGRRIHIDRVVIALPLNAEARILELSKRIMALSVEVVACPDLSGFDLLRRPVTLRGGLPAIQISTQPMSGAEYFVKVAVDKLIAALVVAAIAPLLLAIAATIRYTSPGPVLFRQKRHGFNNREFEVLKFRTMRADLADASGARQAQRHDDRVTPFGKFLRRSSLDELPQLFNVLRGDMSLVGPRPLPVGMRTQDLFNHEIVEQYAHRHRVRPGITGWAQIKGFRGATEFPGQLQKRVELDMYYIENWTLALDLRILCLTTVHLIRSKNAF